MLVRRAGGQQKGLQLRVNTPVMMQDTKYKLLENEATGVAPIRQSLTIPPAQPTVIANTITPKKSRRFLTPLTAPVIANITVPKMSKAYIHSFSITKE